MVQKPTKYKALFKELKYAKEDLDDLQFYLEEFSAFLPLPVLSVNPLGFVLDANRSFEILGGFEKIEILGGPVERFFLEKKKLNKLQQKVLRGEPAEREEITFLSKKRKIPVSVYFGSRKDKEGNIIGYFIGIYDISEFKKLQQSLEEKVKERTKELQERVDELEKFRKLTEGRELRMVGLKQEIKKLKEELEKQKGRK